MDRKKNFDNNSQKPLKRKLSTESNDVLVLSKKGNTEPSKDESSEVELSQKRKKYEEDLYMFQAWKEGYENILRLESEVLRSFEALVKESNENRKVELLKFIGMSLYCGYKKNFDWHHFYIKVYVTHLQHQKMELEYLNSIEAIVNDYENILRLESEVLRSFEALLKESNENRKVELLKFIGMSLYREYKKNINRYHFYIKVYGTYLQHQKMELEYLNSPEALVNGKSGNVLLDIARTLNRVENSAFDECTRNQNVETTTFNAKLRFSLNLRTKFSILQI